MGCKIRKTLDLRVGGFYVLWAVVSETLKDELSLAGLEYFNENGMSEDVDCSWVNTLSAINKNLIGDLVGLFFGTPDAKFVYKKKPPA